MTLQRHAPSFPSLAMRAFARHGDALAFQDGRGGVSHGAVLALLGRFQAVLAARGIGRGQRVALLSANRWESWVAGLAAQALGAATTWLHPMGSLDAHVFQIEDAEVSALVIDADAFGPRGGEIAAKLPSLDVLTLGRAAYGTPLLGLADAAGSQTARDLSRPDDIAALNYTGGTTGRPKGVLRDSAALSAMALTISEAFELPATPRYLAAAPISHVSGTNLVPCFLRGGSAHLLPAFDPEELLTTIERARINFTLTVPTMVYRLLDDPALARHDTSSLELLLYGASPMAPSRLAEALERIGPVFSQLYGQSECYPIAALPRADHDPARPELLTACGFATAASQVALLDEDGQEVPPGEPGEICVRSPIVMRGYWKQPEATEEAFAHGWLHTGDVARQDGQGRLYIVDRKKDMVVTGGFNVYPREVEDVLATHPAVALAAVVGVPDARWGEAVKAYVVLKPGSQVAAQELTALVRNAKGTVHAPKQVEFAASLPLTPLGKLDKKALRAAAWAGQARGVA